MLEAPPTTPGSATVEHHSGVSPAKLSMDGPDAAQQAAIQAKQHSQQGTAFSLHICCTHCTCKCMSCLPEREVRSPSLDT